MTPTPPDLPSPTPETANPMSLGARLTNIIAAPGEVYEHLVSAPARISNWLVPALVFIVVSWAAATALFSQEWAIQEMTVIQEKAIEQGLAQQRLPPDKLEEAKAAAIRITRIAAQVGAYLGPVVTGIGGCFLWGVFLWLVGTKALSGKFGFMKAVEIDGLTGVVSALGAAVKTLLVMVTGNLMTSPGPALLLKGYDPTNPIHNLLLGADIFTFWALWLRSLGLARLSRRSTLAASLWVFGGWLLLNGLFLGLGLLGKALTPK